MVNDKYINDPLIVRFQATSISICNVTKPCTITWMFKLKYKLHLIILFVTLLPSLPS